MSKLLVYTFRHFPYKNKIIKYFPFEFHKLSQDLKVFSKNIDILNPEIIVGVAKSSGNKSTFETKTINKFNKNKKVDKQGKDIYQLNFPITGYRSIVLNKSTSDTFCNWTMYKISQIIEGKNTRLQFIHIKKTDLHDLELYLSSIK